MGLTDLHIHTIYSYDGTASIAETLRAAKRSALDVIAITDHDEIRGAYVALNMAADYGLEVIPGIEVSSADGDVLALFVERPIQAGLSLQKTLEQIGKQGGLAIAAHPMSTGLSMKSLSETCILSALAEKDLASILVGIEVFNATALDKASNALAWRLGQQTKLAQTANSDAHVAPAIGISATYFEGTRASDVRNALVQKATRVARCQHWNMEQVLSSWSMAYLTSLTQRWKMRALFSQELAWKS
jgi:predicted metal-dependent phosphoesterase TrpH